MADKPICSYLTRYECLSISCNFCISFCLCLVILCSLASMELLLFGVSSGTSNVIGFGYQGVTLKG